jgi:hypothetical protein
MAGFKGLKEGGDHFLTQVTKHRKHYLFKDGFRAAGVAQTGRAVQQAQGPEFKPQNCKEREEKRKRGRKVVSESVKEQNFNKFEFYLACISNS